MTNSGWLIFTNLPGFTINLLQLINSSLNFFAFPYAISADS